MSGFSASFACAVWLVEAIVIAALASRAGGARVALVLALGLLAYPFAVDGPAWVRLAFAIGAFWCVVRAADFAFDPPPARFGARLAHLFAIIDTRLVREGPRRFDTAALAKLLVALAVLAIAWQGIEAARPLDPIPRYALRWTAGALFFVASFELVTAAFALATQALGYHAPAVSDAPHRSVSIAEFWSARWNLVVGRVLRERVFEPLARRGPALAIAMTFAASAAFHFYLLLVALGAWWPALAAAAFFVIQPPLLAIERRRMRRRAPTLRRVWTIAVLVVASPLFIEPVLRVIDTVLP